MALLVTLLLMLINMSNSISNDIPLAKSLTAIEVLSQPPSSRYALVTSPFSCKQVWIFACIGFVFMALLEYALLLLHTRSRSFPNEATANNSTVYEVPRKKDRCFEPRSARKPIGESKWFALTNMFSYKVLDVLALVIFFAAFFIFNLFYWNKYLNRKHHVATD